MVAIALVCTLAQSTLSEDLKVDTVKQLAKELRESYVMKAPGDRAAINIERNLKRGVYATITKPEDFAKQLVTDVNTYCHDAHFRIQYSGTPLPKRENNRVPSKAELDSYRKRLKLSNAGFERIERLGGNIGYIQFFNFMDLDAAERPIRAAMEFVKDTDALIFDIRQNGGGSPETVQLLCSYLFDKRIHLNDLYFRAGDETTEFWTLPVKGPKYLDKPIFVVVGKRTGSAAEEFSYNLQTQKRATIIGESTWGGANPGGNVRLNDHFTAFIPAGMAINPITKKNWEGTGVLPDVKVPVADALKEAHKLAVKALLDRATNEDDRSRLKSVLTEVGG